MAEPGAESRFVQAAITLPRAKKIEQVTAEGSTDTGFDPNEGGILNNLLHLLPLVCVPDGQCSTSKRVKNLNNLAKLIKHAGHVIEPNYPVERVIECVRLSLAGGIKEVRAGALRVLRYLLTSKDVFAVMLKHRIDLFVARSLDVPADREIERLQAMRFVRQAISVAGDIFPRSLAAPMVCIIMSDSEPQDNLTWSCMATLCELALYNAEMASQSGAIRALIRGLLKCGTSRISESVILTLSHLLNKPNTRKFIRSQLDIETLLAPITDLHYRHLVEEMDQSSLSQDNNRRVEAAKMSIVALLKSWPGIFSLGSPNNTGLQPLLSMLPLATPVVQREILDVLYSVFQLKVPVWTESFTEAVTSVDPAQAKTEWSLSEGFVAAEGKDLLPPKTVDRTDLVNCYQALLLATVLETGLFDYLVEVCLRAERRVAVMATILLAQLLHQTNTILPAGYSSDAHTLQDLIASAIDFEETQDQSRASEVISCLDRVHTLKKNRVKPSSLYLKLILEQSNYFSEWKKTDSEQQAISSDLDENTVNTLIKDTNVLNTKQFSSWDWSLLLSMLQHHSLRSASLQEDSLFGRFLKRLCNFFMPSKHLYSVIIYNEKNTKRFSAVGQELVKYLCRVEESSSGYLYDLVSDIVNELSQVTASKLTADVFSSSNTSHKLSRDYFLFLGTISFLKPSILRQCKAYGPLLDICNYQNRTDLMRLMLSTLDFGHDVHSRMILNKLLTATDKSMRLYATKHMRVLLRAKMPFFNSWGLELLLPQLYDVDRQVAMEAVDILDEACEEENFLEALVLQQPQLVHLGEKGAALFTRFFSVKRGFTLMSRLGYLELQLENWYTQYNLLYVYIVEERLAETLTSFKQTEEGEFIRRTSTAAIFPKAFVPVHLYGQLVQHEEGCMLLEKENHVSRFAQIIRADLEESYTADDILSRKAAIWALGHIGSSPRGLGLLLNEEIIGDLVDVAEMCPVLSIRGACYYALCLISKTQAGASVLLEANWTTVTHSLEEKWPLSIDPNLEQADLTPFTPGVELPLPPFEVQQHKRVMSYKAFTADKSTITLPGRVAGLGNSPIQPLKLESKDKALNTQNKLTKAESTKAELRPARRMGGRDRFGSLARFEKPTGKRAKNGQLSRRPKSLNVGESLESPMEERKLSYSSFSRSSLSFNSTKSFLGVCLPMDISRLFEYNEPEYEGHVTQVISAPMFSDHDHIPSHDPFHCLECSIPLIKPYHGVGMSISSDSLSSHFLYAPPFFPGGETPRSRAHTMDDKLTDKATKSRMMKTNSDSLPSLANGHHTKESGNNKYASSTGRLDPRNSSSRTPSPLIRMKTIHNSQEEAEARQSGRVLLAPDRPQGTPVAKAGTLASSVVGSQASTVKDPEVLIQIVKPSYSEAGPKVDQVPPSPSPSANTDTSSTTSSNHSQQGVVDEASPEGRSRLQHAILEVVYGLSSDVSQRKNMTGLTLICHRFPSVVQDTCLYSQVMDYLSSYHYNLPTRRLIQSKFEKLNFDPLFAAKPQLDEEFSEDDLISSNSSSRRTSFSSQDANSSQSSLTQFDFSRFRRRSSTSDTSRFREKLQYLSKSAEKHEHMESPRELESSTERGSFNKNSNNNSPEVEGVDYSNADTVEQLESKSGPCILTVGSVDSNEIADSEPEILSVVQSSVYDL